MKPVMAAAAASTEAREEDLVARAQAGNPEAFEALFHRYRDRITGFVRASVRDEGRTEDLVQEIFFSAHSSLPRLEEPAAFQAWLYQIARNACLDEARRRSRQDELILGWDEFPPPDERIMIHHQGADRALSQKEELTNLTEALDGLPQSQQDALVLRELEGMSYDEIGRRMRLTRTAVESVLFRARRGLKGEYAEIETGERCKQMQLVMEDVVEGLVDLGERRKLIRHMRACVGCRNEAAALGIAGLAVPSDDRRGIERAFSRLAAFLPLPAFFSRRPDEGEQLSGASSVAVQAQGAAAQLTAVGGDHAASAIHKAAAVVAAVAVVGGGGVAMHEAGVKLPVLDSITAKKDHGGSAGASDAGGSGLPPEPTGLSTSGNGAGVPGGSVAGATDQGATALAPLGSSAPLADAPLTTNAPTPGLGEAPSTPDATSPDANAPAGSTPAESGSGSDPPKKDKGGTGGSGSGGSSSPAGDSTGTSVPRTPDGQPIPPDLSNGITKQLESGKRTLDELPPGQKKKIAQESAPVTP